VHARVCDVCARDCACVFALAHEMHAST